MIHVWVLQSSILQKVWNCHSFLFLSIHKSVSDYGSKGQVSSLSYGFAAMTDEGIGSWLSSQGPTESWDPVGWRAGVCCGLLLRTGFGKQGYLQLIRAAFKRSCLDETWLASLQLQEETHDFEEPCCSSWSPYLLPVCFLLLEFPACPSQIMDPTSLTAGAKWSASGICTLSSRDNTSRSEKMDTSTVLQNKLSTVSLMF